MSEVADRAQTALAEGRGVDAVAIAEAGAKQNDADALALLATWHLIGSPLPRDLFRARALLRRATDAGSADAALTEVALMANGSGGASDWAGAVALLHIAAQRHGAEAVAQMALLEAMDLTRDGLPAHPPAGRQLSTSPTTLHWPGFITPQECACIAQSVVDILEPSLVADPQTGRLIAHPIRTSSAAVVGPTRESLPVQAILRRIAAVTGTAVEQGESLTVLHYVQGQQYRTHMDALPHEANQRTGTMLLYLNEGYVGGETRFEASGLTFAGRGGDALFFANTLTDKQPDPRSRHAGLPVRSGVKWLATRWLRAAPIDVWGSR